MSDLAKGKKGLGEAATYRCVSATLSLPGRDATTRGPES